MENKKYLSSGVMNNKIIQYITEKKLVRTEKQIEKGIFKLKELIDLRDKLKKEFK